MTLQLTDDFTLEVHGLVRVAPAKNPVPGLDEQLVDVFLIAGEEQHPISENRLPSDALTIVRDLVEGASRESKVTFSVNLG